MIINSDALAILRKEIPLPVLQCALNCSDCVEVSLHAETMDGIIDSEYLAGEEFPFMLVDKERITYTIYCRDTDIAPRWVLCADLPSLHLDNAKKLELLDRAYADGTIEMVYGLILETEEADGDYVSFDLILSEEEQRRIFDLADIPMREQDYILRLQNI